MGKLFKVTCEDNDYGFHMRCVEGRRFHVLRWDDMDAACGADNEGHPRYCATLTELDADIVTEKQFAEVISSCGWERAKAEDGLSEEEAAKKIVTCGGDIVDYTDEMFVYDAVSYGIGAPLWNECGPNLKKLLSEGKQNSRELESDADLYEAAMNRPVNAIGSTAREYGQGDIDSGMMRGIVDGSDSARILGKMHGLSEEQMDSVKPMQTTRIGPFEMVGFQVAYRSLDMPSDDPLAYASGFIDAVSGKGKANAEGGELATAYLKGYREGVSVKTREKPWPAWIRPTADSKTVESDGEPKPNDVSAP